MLLAVTLWQFGGFFGGGGGGSVHFSSAGGRGGDGEGSGARLKMGTNSTPRVTVSWVEACTV